MQITNKTQIPLEIVERTGKTTLQIPEEGLEIQTRVIREVFEDNDITDLKIGYFRLAIGKTIDEFSGATVHWPSITTGNETTLSTKAPEKYVLSSNPESTEAIVFKSNGELIKHTATLIRDPKEARGHKNLRTPLFPSPDHSHRGVFTRGQRLKKKKTQE
jgi:hypothetical protein